MSHFGQKIRSLTLIGPMKTHKNQRKSLKLQFGLKSTGMTFFNFFLFYTMDTNSTQAAVKFECVVMSNLEDIGNVPFLEHDS